MLMHLCALGLLAFANAQDFDMEMRNQYTVVNCQGHTRQMFHLLSTLTSNLVPVIEDANSTDPGAAYTAFFKDRSYAPFISTLLRNITKGVPMTTPRTYSFSGGVTFLCVNATEEYTFNLNGVRRDAYTDCINHPSTTTIYVGFSPPEPFVIVCPSFFASRITPIPRRPPNSKCLSVNKHLNSFYGNGQDVRYYQMWMLFEMIVHYYLLTSAGSFDITTRGDVKACFALGAKQASLSALNYVYYAASKSFFTKAWA